jgi:putative sigma-54 modulation protein
MTIAYTGRKADLTPALRTFTEKKLGKLERFLEEIQDAHVILTLEKHRHLSEVVVKARTVTLTAKGEAADFRDSIGICADRLLAQAKKHRERFAKERKREGMRASPRGLGAAADGGPFAPPPAESGPDGPVIVRLGSIPAKPMSLEEALLQVRASRDPVLIFRNAESQQVAVLFRRADGRFGLVEEET